MIELFQSDAVKGVGAICVACLLFAWPPAVSWLAGSLCLCFAIAKLQTAFQRAEAAERAEAPSLIRSNDAPKIDVAQFLSAGGDRHRPAAR